MQHDSTTTDRAPRHALLVTARARRLLAPFLLAVLLLGAFGLAPLDGAAHADNSADSSGAGQLCSDRAGGALVTLDIVGERLTLWSTNGAFIAEAKDLRKNPRRRVPVFSKLFDGTDCDKSWSWHVSPVAMEWADAAIELCDGTPSNIEADKAYWLDTVGAYCPWLARVVDVQPR